MSGVQIAVSAKLESADIDKMVQELSSQIGRLGQGIAQANKIQYNPFSSAVLQDADKLEARLKRILALHQQIAKITPGINLGGTPGSGGAPAPSVAPNFTPPPPAPGASPASPNPSQQPPQPAPSPASSRSSAGYDRRYRNPWNQTRIGGIVGAGLQAGGPLGNLANNSINSAYAGGGGSFLSGGAMMAGIGGLLGGGLALGISKAIGGVMSKIGDAQQDAIGYDTLKRQLGDVNVSFEALRNSMHKASDAIDVTYPEVLKLGNEFARISGSSDSSGLANEVRVGGGFGRSFGMDPSQSVGFFARMRQFGITQNGSDSQKLGLTIGEAIVRSGAFAKADEVLQAIGGFATQQTRLGLVSANVGGYTSALAGLVGSGIPGLDVGGAANLLSRVNGAIVGGGNVGDAGQNFSYRVLGQGLGLDPIQTRILQEGGAFGSGSSTFGGKAWQAFSKRYGIKTPAGAAGSSATNLQMIMSGFQRNYAGRPELMLDAMHNFFGTSYGQSMALATVSPTQLGGLQSALSGAGVDVNKMSASGISAMAQLVGGNRDELNTQARSLWSRLSPDDAKKLAGAQGGSDDSLRTALLQLTAKYGQEDTEGDKTRKSINDMSKSLTDEASKLVLATNTIRDTLMLAFGKRGDQMMTAQDIHDAVVKGQRDTVNKRADDAISAAKGRLQLASAVDDFGRVMHPDEQKAAYDNLQKVTAAAEAERKSGLKSINDSENPQTPGDGQVNSLPLPAGFAAGAASPAPGPNSLAHDPKMLAYLAETDHIDGLTPGTSYAQIMQESSFNPNAASRVGAVGLAQVMPKTLASLEKKLGRKLDPRNPSDALLIHRTLMAENMKHFGNERDALTAYNDGWNRASWGTNAESANYAPTIMGHAPMYSFMTPDGGGAANGSSGKQTFEFQHNIMLQNQNGAPIAPPVTVSKQVGPPSPSGTN